VAGITVAETSPGFQTILVFSAVGFLSQIVKSNFNHLLVHEM
jgi:hypothetical protein